MTLKQFNADLAAASRTSFPGVRDVRRGDSDGEVVFTLESGQFGSPLDIQALALDLDRYPSSSAFMLFTTTDLKHEGVDTILQQLASLCRGKTVHDIISTISSRMTGEAIPCDGNGSDEGEFDNDEYDHEGTEVDDFEAEESFFLQNCTSSHSPIDFDNSNNNNNELQRLREDLRAAHEAGLRVGVLKKPLLGGFEMISLSIRASKLGISEETLEAWDLRPTNYLVLLLRFPDGYPAPADFLDSDLPMETKVSTRFGACQMHKPSLDSARRAFQAHTRSRQRRDEQEPGSGADPWTIRQPQDDDFLHLQMSKAIEDILSEQLSRLVTTRRAHSIGWDEAQGRVSRLIRPQKEKGDDGDNKATTTSDEGPMITKTTPEPLRHDFAMDSIKSFNLCLVHMQFALRRFAKCTQYCLICHKKLAGGFEAVKPYVCLDELCLYQYMSLGLQTSIEREIVNSPHVVDLLVSLFYAALKENSVRVFPSGLGIKTCLPGTITEPKQHLAVQVEISARRMHFEQKDVNRNPPMGEGDSFLLVPGTALSARSGDDELTQLNPNRIPILYGDVEQYFCRVVSVGDGWCDFEILLAWKHNLRQVEPEMQAHRAATSNWKKWPKAMVFLQDHEVDDLLIEERIIPLIFLTSRIPPILSMRKYLLEKEGRQLNTMKGLDSNVLSLLRWIIVSNTSLIVQDDDVPDWKTDKDNHTDNTQKVQGLGEGWMQFRFVQGSPQKEQQFIEELDKLKQDNRVPAQYPTMFAWHGSPLGNWHSIIRSGLDFQSVVHGRSLGNGVYFSGNLSTSLGYGSGRFSIAAGGAGLDWPNSQLSVSSAVSMCEIINCQKDFVCSTPHYVVSKTQWIQCRYLFARVQPTTLAQMQSLHKPPAQPCSEYLVLDPSPMGATPGQTIDVPSSVLPASRRSDFNTKPIKGLKADTGHVFPGNSAEDAIVLSDDEEDLLEIDLSLGNNDHRIGDDSSFASPERKRRRDIDSEPGDLASKTRLMGREPAARKVTMFTPGTLDLNSLPKVPEPAWADSTTSGALRSLNRGVKELQKIQASSTPESLGWHIEFEKMNNVFHWIVELHSFDLALPLAQDMEAAGCNSIVLELRFGSGFPFSPPFVRVVRPRFLPYSAGGGGHVTSGGAICSEMLTNSGWSPALSIDKVFLDVRLRLGDLDPPARLAKGGNHDYSLGEAAEAYRRAVIGHGWAMPPDLDEMIKAGQGAQWS